MKTTVFTSGYWNHIKPQLLKKYPELTEFDLMYKQGELREMMHHLEIKLHKTDKEFREILNNIH